MGLFDILWPPKPPKPTKPAVMRPTVKMFPTTKEKDGDGFYPIVCPYCLERFHIWEVEFRSVAAGVSKAPMVDREIIQNQVVPDEKFGRRQKQQSAPVQNAQARPSMPTSTGVEGATGFPMEVDEKYEEFERKVNGTEVGSFRGKVLRIFDENGNPTGEVTHITLMNREDGGIDNNNVRIPIKGHVARDFAREPIMTVINKFGEACDERICPHCHHKVSDYVGIWPSYTVALIGDTKVGKTVFLSKLGAALTRSGILGHTLIGHEANMDYKSWIRTAMEMDERAMSGASMLDLTTMKFMPPNTINFHSTVPGKGFILNLFDFPGEALSQPLGGASAYGEDTTSIANGFRAQYVQKIERMDAWMLLFDSISFETVRSVFETDEDLKFFLSDRSDSIQPVELLNYFENAYLRMHGNKFTKPLAAIMSKSDLIKYAEWLHPEYFPTLAEDQAFLDPNRNQNRDKTKVDLDDIFNCSCQIGAFLEESRDDKTIYDRCNEYDQVNGESCWFAVSSKGDANAAAADPIRVTEPIEWILWRLGLVQGQGKSTPGGGSPIEVK